MLAPGVSMAEPGPIHNLLHRLSAASQTIRSVLLYLMFVIGTGVQEAGAGLHSVSPLLVHILTFFRQCLERLRSVFSR